MHIRGTPRNLPESRDSFDQHVSLSFAFFSPIIHDSSAEQAYTQKDTKITRQNLPK